MGRLLFVIFIVVPLLEIAFFVMIGNAIGLWPTLLGVLVMAVAGALILRYQGMAILGEIRGSVARGMLPTRALADGMMIAMAGVLLLTPGYFTDLLGLLLLVPAVRGTLYGFVGNRIRIVAPAPTGYRPPPGGRGGTIDLDESDWRRR